MHVESYLVIASFRNFKKFIISHNWWAMRADHIVANNVEGAEDSSKREGRADASNVKMCLGLSHIILCIHDLSDEVDSCEHGLNYL